MHFRRVKSRRDGPPEDGATPEPATGAEEGAARTPLLDHVALDRALAQLPPGYRAVFIPNDIEGYEHDEVARLLGCASGTSKSQPHKARAKLRQLLGERRRRGEHLPRGRERPLPACRSPYNLYHRKLL